MTEEVKEQLIGKIREVVLLLGDIGMAEKKLAKLKSEANELYDELDEVTDE